MAILSLDDYISAKKQKIIWRKTGSLTTVANYHFDPLAVNGLPGAGTLAGSNTANGVVPTDADTGFPPINTFDGGAKGYLTGVMMKNDRGGSYRLVDVLFKAGAYAFNANVTLSTQPSYASRVPGGTDFKGTEIWIEAVTAFTGNQSIAITYTDQDGNAGATTGTIATGVAPIVGRMYPIPLAAGDTGVQKIESVVSTVSTVGTFNVLVVRPLWEGDIRAANSAINHNFIDTGMPEVFDNSALTFFVCMDSTSIGIPSAFIEIASK